MHAWCTCFRYHVSYQPESRKRSFLSKEKNFLSCEILVSFSFRCFRGIPKPTSINNPGGHQEGEHGAVLHVQRDHHQFNIFLSGLGPGLFKVHFISLELDTLSHMTCIFKFFFIFLLFPTGSGISVVVEAGNFVIELRLELDQRLAFIFNLLQIAKYLSSEAYL